MGALLYIHTPYILGAVLYNEFLSQKLDTLYIRGVEYKTGHFRGQPGQNLNRLCISTVIIYNVSTFYQYTIFFSGSGENVFFFKVKVTHCWRCRFGICDISAVVYNQNYALFNHFSQKYLMMLYPARLHCVSLATLTHVIKVKVKFE